MRCSRQVLEPFSAKWRDPLYEAVSASAAGKMEAADVRKVIGHHVTAVPTSIVVEAAEDPTSAAERLNDWNANAVPIIKVTHLLFMRSPAPSPFRSLLAHPHNYQPPVV